MSDKGKSKILLVTGWWRENNRSTFQTAAKLVKVLQPLGSRMSWIITNQTITGTINDNISFEVIRSRYVEGHLLKVFIFYWLHQLKVSVAILKFIKRADVLVFAFGSDALLLPVIIGRIIGKKVIIRSDGRPSYIIKKYYHKRNPIKIAWYSLVELVTYSLADRILPESLYMVKLYNLQRYKNKIYDGGLYIDTSIFKSQKSIKDRAYAVGYIGRFSDEKGVLEFVRSLTIVLAVNQQARAVLIGDGELKNQIEMILTSNNIQDRVDLVGWVSQEELASLLNDIKLVVVPSYREGLPNIILESMACGCVVIGNSVGGIPGIISDGQNGYILESNSPKRIIAGIEKALNNPALERISTSAHQLITQKYIFEIALKRYESIIRNI